MAKNDPKENSAKAALDFEAALNQLQEIVTRMESSEQTLETSIQDYEKGAALAALCQQRLEEAQLKVEKLTKTAEGYRRETLDLDKSGA